MDSSTINDEPWPANGISEYKSIDDGEWGYLVYKDGQFIFDGSRRPSDDEIMSRWGDRLAMNKSSSDK